MRETFLTGLTISRKFLLAVLALFSSQAPLQATPLSMFGNTYWRQNGGMVTIHVDRISNTSTNETSGSLRLRLWATPTRYSGGGPITGFVVSSYGGLSPLGPNQYFLDVTVPC